MTAVESDTKSAAVMVSASAIRLAVWWDSQTGMLKEAESDATMAESLARVSAARLDEM